MNASLHILHVLISLCCFFTRIVVEGGEARSVEEAIAVLSVASDAVPAVDRHPEKRMKAAYEDFEKVGSSVLLMA
jgi:hypothetical protein